VEVVGEILVGRRAFYEQTNTCDHFCADLVSAMPSQSARIRLRERTGTARIVQVANPDNAFTTIVQVEGNQESVSFTLGWWVIR
jgi:hypothetical protein